MNPKHPRFAIAAFLLWVTCLHGATNHWAYLPLGDFTPPIIENQTWARTAIDGFVLEKLKQSGLEPAPPADARSLLRRLHLDLTGLPPTQDELNRFLADPAANYERSLDQLLASPRYGERWARLWMDAIHFAETHGHDQDRIRTNAWPYRDYLIKAFNDDKPFQQFVQEQLAGDVLYPDDPQATVALGLVAAGPWDESSLRDIREDTLDRQIGRYLDRDDMVSTVMQTFTSSTVQCARCHNHKFDPISQDDYYSLQAVFAGVDRANRTYDSDPAVHLQRQKLLALLRRVEKREPALLLSEEATRLAAEGERRLQSSRATWTTLPPDQVSSQGNTVFKVQSDGSILATQGPPDSDTYTVQARCATQNWTALRLELLTDESLPKNGPGRAENGNLHLSEVEVESTSAKGQSPVALAHPTADFNQDGWTIQHALDGSEATAWGIHPQEGQPHLAVFEFKEKLEAPSQLKVVLKQLHGRKHTIGKFRLAVTDAAPPITADPLPAAIQQHLAVERDQRSEEARIELAAYFYREKIEQDLDKLPKPSLIYAAASEFAPDGGLKPSGGPRLVQVLARGNILTPLHQANAGALTCVAALPPRFELTDPQKEGTRRAALARWLSHRDNPLVWRSIVNRVWFWHFGHGLVETPNDFGALGGKPSHPELLDWLATWFRDEAGGSLKELHRLILSSAVWQQAVESSNAKAGELDADNRWLWRMNRRRLDAEQVRDSILWMCDRLDLRMGGPSDQQFGLQPGIHVTPRVDYTTFDVDGTAGRRRSIYRFLFRTLPDPFMDALDCPSGDELTPVRHASVTVQQALALWNNAFVVRHAEHLAERLEFGGQRSEDGGRKTEDGGQRAAPERSEGGRTDDGSQTSPLAKQVTQAFELILGRGPTAEEREEFYGYAQKHGLANLCRLLLNSNEFMFVN